MTIPEATHGRNRITTRALKQVVSAVAAEAMGVPARQVGVQLADANGLLQVTAIAPIRVLSLTAPRRAADAAGSILARATAAQATIRDRVLHLTGSSIGQVTVRLNDANIQAQERVQ
ncbi:hypothetical protein GY21_01225 [Cryobacterium roopkundense]|uniref:Putative alkaline shock family protein YloU n=1 Tax=Cryobacterium roopkundense TaxID=1001240 RepID=A0A099JWG1_9MICO|nr:hypothetical protein [Cryobacterium roopkundense]KGJ81738.1 hypothetical protein GY21_01225 [Cryobacterium roopkundense]MBB5642467.1 putative alkaline shock family protein YloU [Cryobacterium roopkundense]